MRTAVAAACVGAASGVIACMVIIVLLTGAMPESLLPGAAAVGLLELARALVAPAPPATGARDYSNPPGDWD